MNSGMNFYVYLTCASAVDGIVDRCYRTFAVRPSFVAATIATIEARDLPRPITVDVGKDKSRLNC